MPKKLEIHSALQQEHILWKPLEWHCKASDKTFKHNFYYWLRRSVSEHEPTRA